MEASSRMQRLVTTRLPTRWLYALCHAAIPLYYLYRIPLFYPLRLLTKIAMDPDSGVARARHVRLVFCPVPMETYLRRGPVMVRGGRAGRDRDASPNRSGPRQEAGTVNRYSSRLHSGGSWESRKAPRAVSAPKNAKEPAPQSPLK